MDLFSPIIEIVKDGWSYLSWFYVLDEYEAGVVLRNGKLKKSVGPGFHWKLPFFDVVLTCITSLETFSTRAQCVLTKDNVSVMIEGAVKGSIDDPEKHLLKVRDFENALSDITQGIIKKVVSQHTFAECLEKDIDASITNRTRTQADKFGVKVESVILTTFDRTRSIRILSQ